MGINPNDKDYEKTVDFMRADLESGMAYTKMEMALRKRFEKDGRDFDEEFKKHKEGKGVL